MKINRLLCLALVIAAASLSACRRGLPTAAESPVSKTGSALTETAPQEYPQEAPPAYAPAPAMQGYNAPPPNVAANNQINTMKVDQDFLHQWRAVGVAAFGDRVFVAASDEGSLSKGTVIEMKGPAGRIWREIGGKFLGLRHPMEASVSGVALVGEQVLTIDKEGNLFTITNGQIKKHQGSAGRDIAAGGGNIYIATLSGTVEKLNPSFSGGTPIPQVRVTGGIGADVRGQLYAVADLGIAMVDLAGRPRLVIPRSQLSNPIDVAADSRTGDIYVLDGKQIKRFDAQGRSLIAISTSTEQPVSIAIDEAGKIYVADAGGSDFRKSKVLVFDASTPLQSAEPQQPPSVPNPPSYTNYSNPNTYNSYNAMPPQTGYGQGYPPAGNAYPYPQDNRRRW